MENSERYWAGVLLRKAQDAGEAKRDLRLEDLPCAKYFAWRFEPGCLLSTETHLRESLANALINPNSVTAFRSLLQAVEYKERAKDESLADAVRVAKNRIERMLKD